MSDETTTGAAAAAPAESATETQQTATETQAAPDAPETDRAPETATDAPQEDRAAETTTTDDGMTPRQRSRKRATERAMAAREAAARRTKPNRAGEDQPMTPDGKYAPKADTTDGGDPSTDASATGGEGDDAPASADET
ncbi:MAG: hypothetical protein ACOC8B_06815, partial [Gemmatimonadota bacterium]